MSQIWTMLVLYYARTTSLIEPDRLLLFKYDLKLWGFNFLLYFWAGQPLYYISPLSLSWYFIFTLSFFFSFLPESQNMLEYIVID